MRFYLHAKIHRAVVTEAELDYVGSITIDENLMDAVGIRYNEKVLITSVTSGSRLETYVIPGKRGSGHICMNGPTAHLIKKGEIVVIMGFELSDKEVIPRVILPSNSNKEFKFINL